MSQSPIFDYCCHGIERGDCDQCSRAMTDTRSSPDDVCRDCGLPRREHHHDGAAYGVCGQFSELAHHRSSPGSEKPRTDWADIGSICRTFASEREAITAIFSGRMTPGRNFWKEAADEIERLRAAAQDAPEPEDWREDPSADERWNLGLDFGMNLLCDYLGIDKNEVEWDAATETVEGDVSAVLGNILRTKFGEDWSPAASPPSPVAGETSLQKMQISGRNATIEECARVADRWGDGEATMAAAEIRMLKASPVSSTNRKP